MQDTATQAMTEVALGLSMAFFALLILALISSTLPKTANADTASATSPAPKSNKAKASEQASLQDLSTNTLKLQSPDSSSDQDPIGERNAAKNTILFYWQGAFYDTNIGKVNIRDYKQHENLIIAVSKSSSLQEVLTLQQQFTANSIQLTAINDEWESALKSVD